VFTARTNHPHASRPLLPFSVSLVFFCCLLFAVCCLLFAVCCCLWKKDQGPRTVLVYTGQQSIIVLGVSGLASSLGLETCICPIQKPPLESWLTRHETRRFPPLHVLSLPEIRENSHVVGPCCKVPDVVDRSWMAHWYCLTRFQEEFVHPSFSTCRKTIMARSILSSMSGFMNF